MGVLTWMTLVGALCAHAAAPAPFLPTGSLLRVVVNHSIYSYNLDVPVIAELESDAQYCQPLENQECYGVVLPRKTKILGRALILKSHNRVNVEFYGAVLPDGREIIISGLALSPDGSAGLIGKVRRHKDSMVASAALKGALTGAAAASAGENPVAAGAADSLALEAAKEVDLAREKVDTSIETPPFARALIYLLQRIEIPAEAPPERRDKQEGGKR
ncbi:MAG: hypothetical protein HYT79_11385 [Elusimicrobia bacterium]|nr:hypothetical protein [Elusimicrobiota bacterium]